jgi:hypothetical protein
MLGHAARQLLLAVGPLPGKAAQVIAPGSRYHIVFEKKRKMHGMLLGGSPRGIGIKAFPLPAGKKGMKFGPFSPLLMVHKAF